MRRRPLVIIAALATLAAGLPFAGRADAVNAGFFGTAIKGYDPVAYFTEGRPVEGSRSFTHDWQGATWRFASAANRDRFAAAPEAYAPRYGGFCAWAVSQGYTADIDPAAWHIADGRLYLNYSLGVREQWLVDVSGHIAKGDANWPAISAKLTD